MELRLWKVVIHGWQPFTSDSQTSAAALSSPLAGSCLRPTASSASMYWILPLQRMLHTLVEKRQRYEFFQPFFPLYTVLSLNLGKCESFKKSYPLLSQSMKDYRKLDKKSHISWILNSNIFSLYYITNVSKYACCNVYMQMLAPSSDVSNRCLFTDIHKFKSLAKATECCTGPTQQSAYRKIQYMVSARLSF